MMQLLRYGLVGVLNTGLGYAVIFLSMGVLDWRPVPSNIAGYAVGLIVSFLLNKNFTFRSRGPARGELKRFLLIFGLAYLANLGVLVLLVNVMDVPAGWAQVVAGVVYFALSFVLNKFYVFADRAQAGHV
ncbi:GtrA family protein [Burkholderiales bacterium 8X]|nr:GtrA family protein [Burkholderiales bacterium 8X]